MMKNKSTLAKLLSEEDIFVVHKQMETAYFNSKSRELGLPIWKDEEMTPVIYDLMVCHEIGHALWTPLDMLEKAAVRKINHSFVNILEDARIEKMVKDKYPGAIGVFKRGYKELAAKDFFGTAGKDTASLNLIDRINLFFKGNSDVTFSNEEKVWVEKTAKTETPDDVLDLAEELYKWMEENESETDNHNSGEESEMGMPDPNGESGEGEGESDNSDGENENDDNSGNKSDTGNSDDSDDAEDGEGSSSGEGEEIDEDSNDNGSAGNNSVGDDNSDSDSLDDGVKESTPEGGVNSSGKGSAPVATTDTASKDGMDKLRDKVAADRIYANIPKLNTDEIIVSYSDLIKEFGEYYNKEMTNNSLYGIKCAEEVVNLKSDSKKIVSYMVKEFEMKKAADQYARAAVSKTGSLDMGRLHTYKYNEDLFKKVTTLPGATNHGMVMVLDWSGSMSENLKGTLSQLFNLVWFCRQTQIPFEVFAFSDAYGRNRFERCYDGFSSSQTYKAGDLIVRDFKLLNFFSSNMSTKEEIEMMNILFMYTNRYGGYRDWSADGYPYDVPNNLHLGGTPLNDAIIAMMDILPKFKSDTGVQKVNTVFLTDGASNNLAGVMDYRLITEENDREGEVGTHVKTTKQLSDWRSNAKVIFTDPVINTTIEVDGYTDTLLKMLKNRVYDMNVVGFFIAGSGRSGRVDKRTIAYACGIDSYGADLMDLVKKINKEKYLAVTSAGYDEYYILPGGNSLMVENSGLSDELVGASKAKLKTAFGKSMKGKIESRQLLNKFVKMVA